MFGFNKNKSKLNLSKPQSNIFRYKFEAIGVLFIALFFILFSSLISYNPTDRSWFFFSNSKATIQNWCGILGANFSALLFYLFGHAAYLFVMGVAFLSYLFIKTKSFSWFRSIAFLVLTISTAAFFFAFNINLTLGLFTKNLTGGLLGQSFFEFTTFVFGDGGGKIFQLGLLFSSIIIVGQISVFTILKKSFILTFNFLKLTSFYLLKGAAKLIKFIWVATINFFKFIYKQSKHLVVRLFKKKYGQVLAARNKGVRQESIVEYSYGFSEFNDNPFFSEFDSVIMKFKSKQIFNLSRKANIKSISFFLLPNTILNKNIFSDGFAANFFRLLLEKKEINKIEQILTQKQTKIFVAPKIEYKLPDTKIFETDNKVDEKLKKELEEEGLQKSQRLEEKLSYFGIKGKVTAIRPGPVITLFEYKPEIDSKISKIIALEDDLALALMALSIRIVAPIPGRSVVGFEISNKSRQKVTLSNLLNSSEFKKFKGNLPIVFGVDIVGHPVIQDLAQMPHLLVAGSTGSGKSVGMNAMLASLLCNFSPEELKLILIDPKRLEFAPYKDIPQLLFPIITNPRSAAPVLKWLVQEMERRYDLMAQAGVRNISEYQEYLKNNKHLEMMPFIVLMIDELADLMMVAGKDIELHIARIAQMARAAGIHMIVATQRPSVDVVTGLIKVNFPSRIAFRVTSKIDSRTIIDGSGAEKLLVRGDMLYMNSVSSDLQRIHGAYVGVKEVEMLASFLRDQAEPEYLDLNETLKEMTQQEVETVEDDLYPEVIEFLYAIDELSISGLQRKYRIGFNRSARLIERLEMDGFLAPAQGSKPRKVLKENL
ncbi:MAG: DNA translocase FtsK [bacterium]